MQHFVKIILLLQHRQYGFKYKTRSLNQTTVSDLHQSLYLTDTFSNIQPFNRMWKRMYSLASNLFYCQSTLIDSIGGHVKVR